MDDDAVSGSPAEDDLQALTGAGLSVAEAKLVLAHRQTFRVAVPAPTLAPAPTLVSGADSNPAIAHGRPRWVSLAVALVLAVLAGVIMRQSLYWLSQNNFAGNDETAVANLLFVPFIFLISYFAWLKRINLKGALFLAGAALALLLVVNLFPLIPGYQAAANPMTNEAQSQTGTLTFLHLPVILWLLAGVAYAGGRWRQDEKRLDFIRFTGELGVFLVLTWLVGGTIIGLVIIALNISGIEIWRWGFTNLIFLVPLWLFLSVWLTEQTRSVVSKVLSVLTMIFTPIMVIALLVIFGVFLSSGTLFQVHRDLLILLDAVLVTVLALVIYAVASRDAASPAGVFDVLQLVMITLAAVMNLIALIWMFARLAEFGWTANRAAAFGLNLLLMVNLVGTGWRLIAFMRSRRAIVRNADPKYNGPNFADADYEFDIPNPQVGVAGAQAAGASQTTFDNIIQWQTRYLPVYAIWAAAVVLLFPLFFAIEW